MSNIARLPDADGVFIGVAIDEETGKERLLLDQFIDGKRTRIGEFSSIFEVIAAIDTVAWPERPGGEA